jgi:predicted nucleotidyltransferase
VRHNAGSPLTSTSRPSHLLGIPVDVGPADALREDIRDQVLAEARAL